jgi:Glycosyl transferases group 1
VAKVLLTTFTNMPGGVLDSFRQGFVDSLLAQGNQVLLLKANDLIEDWQRTNRIAPHIAVGAVTAKIAQFAPDLIISLNHSGLYSELLKSFDCPIAIWLLDGPTYVVDSDEFRRQSGRYHIFSPVKAFGQELELDFCFEASRIHYLPFCSDFRNQPATLVHTISFVGTFFDVGQLNQKLTMLSARRAEWLRFIELLKSYKTDPNILWKERLQRYRLEMILTSPSDEGWILNTIAINNRVKTLDAIEDLGLTIFGNPAWLGVAPYSIDLAMAFHSQQVSARRDLESIYNSSKIAFNISHAQARGGLPWRVFDAMACGSALVSNSAEDLCTLFGKDVEIPTYQSPAEARAVCQSLLADDSRRLHIIEASNKAIESAHRFKHRLKTIGEALGCNLLPGGKGTMTKIDPEQVSVGGERNSFNADPTKTINSSLIQFPVELFYSPTLEFGEDKKMVMVKLVGAGEDLAVSFDMKKAATFLRLDLGFYFSTHENAKISISKSGSKNNEQYELDLKKDILAKNQFAIENGQLICGFDSHCIFRNPFEGEDISLRFQSKLTSGI